MENIMKFLCEMVARDSLHQLEKTIEEDLLKMGLKVSCRIELLSVDSDEVKKRYESFLEKKAREDKTMDEQHTSNLDLGDIIISAEQHKGDSDERNTF